MEEKGASMGGGPHPPLKGQEACGYSQPVNLQLELCSGATRTTHPQWNEDARRWRLLPGSPPVSWVWPGLPEEQLFKTQTCSASELLLGGVTWDTVSSTWALSSVSLHTIKGSGNEPPPSLPGGIQALTGLTEGNLAPTADIPKALRQKNMPKSIGTI